MDKIPAKVSISIRDGIIEFGGSEKFVNDQIKTFKDVIDQVLKNNEEKPFHVAAGKVLKSISGSKPSESKHENVFEINNENVVIIADIPGEKKPEKTVNAALLYLYAKHTLGIDSVPFTEIRTVCKNHGFLDESNFSTYMKNARMDILPEGGGKSMKAKLTQPGLKKAKALIDSLNEEPSL